MKPSRAVNTQLLLLPPERFPGVGWGIRGVLFYLSEDKSVIFQESDWLQRLEGGWAQKDLISGCPSETKFEFLADFVFRFTTYDSEMADLFGRKALEVCQAINDRTTFDYIENEENYRWYLLMVNTEFFAGRLEWGTSIRGAWWDGKQPLSACGLWEGEEPCTEDYVLGREDWEAFIRAIIKFSCLK